MDHLIVTTYVISACEYMKKELSFFYPLPAKALVDDYNAPGLHIQGFLKSEYKHFLIVRTCFDLLIFYLGKGT